MNDYFNNYIKNIREFFKDKQILNVANIIVNNNGNCTEYGVTCSSCPLSDIWHKPQNHWTFLKKCLDLKDDLEEGNSRDPVYLSYKIKLCKQIILKIKPNQQLELEF